LKGFFAAKQQKTVIFMSTRKPLLPKAERYFKANLHAHSSISDGNFSPEELKNLYKEKGYSILAITDHNIIVDHSDLNDEDFLLLTAAEYNINNPDMKDNIITAKTYHINFISKTPDNLWMPYRRPAYRESSQPYLDAITFGDLEFDKYDLDVVNKIIAAGNEHGFLTMYNHPVWSLQTREDYAGLCGLWGMEICNYSSFICGYEENNDRVFQEMLNLGMNVYPLGTDDIHSIKDLAGAWIMIGAEKLEYGSVISALEKGDFYASTGPEIYSLETDGENIYIKCSDARSITVQSHGRYAKSVLPKNNDGLVREAVINISHIIDKQSDNKDAFVRFTVHGPYGHYASTRAYSLDEIKMK